MAEKNMNLVTWTIFHKS